MSLSLARSGRITTARSGTAVAMLLATFAGAARAHAQPAEVAAPLATERAILERYCVAGPRRAHATALVGEGEAAVDVAAVVPNPTLEIEHNRSLTAEEDAETLIGVGFPLGIGGRRFLLSDAADAHLAEKSAQAGAVMIDGALDLREALVRAVAERERANVLSAQQAALTALGATLTGLKVGGESSEHDLLRHGLELEVHETRVALQLGQSSSAKAKLKAHLGGAIDLSGLTLPSLASEPAPAASVVPPMLQSFDAAIRAFELEAEAANRKWVPDLELFFGYRQVTALETETGHGFALRVGIPITFFDHGQGEAAVALSAAASARAARSLLLARADAETAAADETLAALAPPSGRDPAESAKRSSKLLEQAKTLYLAGEGSLTEVLAAAALAESTALAKIDTDEARALARIAKMRASGSLFDAALDRACGGTSP
ncbi:MAG: TolC family protein [Polyangiaceae bacterium]|nr:TolC family protein [Polyangiaceae bacterium]